MEPGIRMRSKIADWSLLLVVAAVLMLQGCASTKEHDSYSDRPWNTPRGWEHTLPPGMTQGR
jgi:hypothetical protein